jgi:hypothetical protein
MWGRVKHKYMWEKFFAFVWKKYLFYFVYYYAFDTNRILFACGSSV